MIDTYDLKPGTRWVWRGMLGLDQALELVRVYDARLSDGTRVFELRTVPDGRLFDVREGELVFVSHAPRKRESEPEFGTNAEYWKEFGEKLRAKHPDYYKDPL